MCVVRGVRCTVVDPTPLRLSEYKTKKVFAVAALEHRLRGDNVTQASIPAAASSTACLWAEGTSSSSIEPAFSCLSLSATWDRTALDAAAAWLHANVRAAMGPYVDTG